MLLIVTCPRCLGAVQGLVFLAHTCHTRCVSTSKASRWTFWKCPETCLSRDVSFMNFIVKEKPTLDAGTTDESTSFEDQLLPSVDYFPPLRGACWWDLDICSSPLSFCLSCIQSPFCFCIAQPWGPMAQASPSGNQDSRGFLPISWWPGCSWTHHSGSCGSVVSGRETCRHELQ